MIARSRRSRHPPPVVERGHDLRAPVGEARDHLALGGERLLVGVGGGDLDAAAAEEAVSVRHAAGGQSECRHRHDRRAVQREQPMRRPDELDRGAVRALIRHDLGDRQLRERVVERGLEAARKRDAGGDRVQEHRIGLAIRFAGEPVVPVDRVRPEIGEVRAAEPREALAQRGGGAVVGVERNARRHQLLRERLVRRHREHVRDLHRKPPRRRVRRLRARGLQEAAVAQAVEDAFGEGLAQQLQRLGRQLLGEQLDGQRRRRRHCIRPARFRPEASIGKPSASRES